MDHNPATPSPSPRPSPGSSSSYPAIPGTLLHLEIEPRSRQRTSWYRVSDVVLCLAQVVAKSVSYPHGDPATFARLESSLGLGLASGLRRAPIGDLCQELRAVLRCPRSELIAGSDGDEWGPRLVAVALVLRDYGKLSDAVFDELAVGLVSWRPTDRNLIAKTLDELLTA